MYDSWFGRVSRSSEHRCHDGDRGRGSDAVAFAVRAERRLAARSTSARPQRRAIDFYEGEKIDEDGLKT